VTQPGGTQVPTAVACADGWWRLDAHMLKELHNEVLGPAMGDLGMALVIIGTWSSGDC